MEQRKLFRTLMERQDKDITNSKVAEAMEVSDATISNFLNYKNELTLTSWILAIRYLAPEREDYIIDVLADEMIKTENRLNCRLLMEYASTKRNFPLLNKLIESQAKAPKENKDWSEVYKINMMFQKREKTPESIMKILEQHSPKSAETKVFTSILKAHLLYMMKEYKAMFRVAKEVEKDVESIKNKYIRENYIARLCDLFAHGYLYLKSDVKKARYYANLVINSKLLCPIFTSHMYHLLGTSFVFEDFDKSFEYFNTYKELLIQQNRQELAKETMELDMFFLNVFWGKDTQITETNDPLEKLHFYARKKDAENFEKLLTSVDKDDPFTLCYIGIFRNDPEYLLKSTAKFIENGNKFFAELPQKALCDHPVFSISAKVMCSINIA